jgi:hypothetical protein
MRVMNAVALAALLLTTAGSTALAQDKPADAAASVAVGPQYDTAHVYVVPRRRGPLYRYCHRNVRRYQVPTSCFDNHPDAQQDDVAGGVHAGRHVLRVRFHEADPISVRPRTNRLPRDRHGYSNPIGDGQRSRRCRGTVRGFPLGAMPSCSGRAAFICSCTGTRLCRITRNSTGSPKTGCTCRRVAPMRSSARSWDSREGRSFPTIGMHRA